MCLIILAGICWLQVLAFTPSKRFIVKSIHGTEHETLLNLAPRLCAHLDQNDKLLCSFLLHFEIRGDSAAAGCYFVMNNCLPILDKARFQFKYTFDLKGCIDDKMMVNDGEKVKQVHRRDGCCWFGCDIEWSICNTAERKKYESQQSRCLRHYQCDPLPINIV